MLVWKESFLSWHTRRFNVHYFRSRARRKYPSLPSPPLPSPLLLCSSPAALLPTPPPPRSAEIKGWGGSRGQLRFRGNTATWIGPADASGRTPRGHGVLAWDGGGVSEGAMDDLGRMQGEWVGRTADGALASCQCVDDDIRDPKARRGRI